jgi:hypothetical protein
MKGILLRATIIWIVYLPLAIANYTIAERYIRPDVDELTAHQISTLVSIISFLVLSAILWKTALLKDVQLRLFAAGLYMATLTAAFRLVFGHFVQDTSWQMLLNDYAITEGRMWIIFLVTISFSPALVKLIRTEKNY